MPRIPAYMLAWVASTQAYEIYETRNREGGGCRVPQRSAAERVSILRARLTPLPIVPDSPAWFAWLDQASSFAFVGQSGHYTARKEARQRGDRYWSAYLATGDHLMKKYLGKTANLTLARLEQVASVLEAEQIAKRPTGQETPLLPLASTAQTPPAETLASARTDAEVEITQCPLAAQRDTTLHPLLATKLHVPRPRTYLVPRPHLVERLQQGADRALTLISAPAGFGKTTLLAQWFAQNGLPVAWLSLEPEDNDPTRFLSYLIAALQTLDAQLGMTALAMLHTPQPAPPETVLAMLVSDVISHGGGKFALVLDDYHVLTAKSIERGMTFLLEHLPPQMHLVLATRADPPLPLARLRVQGQLTEVRTADLRFGAAEVSAFLHTVMGLNLEASAIASLEQRTEGWIVGLQLAALSLQGRVDASAFLSAFSGSHRYVLDYLSDEVLARQPAPVQQFLLHTSILGRLSGSLCDAVTAQEGSQAMLEALYRANLFVVALDDERGWYRYHHLFAEVLHRHLQQAEPTLMPTLHRRASAWYEQHDLPIEAVQHALLIPNFELAARLIEPIVLPLAFQGQLYTVLGWLSTLPEALVRARPRLCVYYAVLLLITNQLEAAEARLQDAELSIQEEIPAEQTRTIQGYVLAIRSGIASFSGDIMHGVSLARQALELPETEALLRAGALATAIRAYLVSGDVTPTAEREIAVAVAYILTSGNLLSTVSSICLLARLHVLQGRLRQAADTYAQVVQVVPRPEVLQTLFTSLFYYFGIGDLLRERNDLDAAERHLAQGMALVKETLTLEPLVAVLGYTALARLRQARGNTTAALATLDTLTQVAKQRHFADHLVTQGAAVRAQLELAQGNVTAAIHWADSSGLSATDDDLWYPREGEYLALARVRIAQGRADPAALFLQDVLRLLDRLQASAEPKARLGSVLEILVLRALAQEAQGDRTSALSTLERVLVLAAPEGYIRLFADEGPPMLALLHQARVRSSVPGYVATLLRVFGEQQTWRGQAPPLLYPVGSEFSSIVREAIAANMPWHVSNAGLAPAMQLSSPPSPLTEPLTEREREVLRLLLEGASNREIARRLVLSVNTVKRHVYNLCGKLGVQSRTQVIIRARALNLL